jgi:flagellar biosynthesis protein FlhB
VFFIKQKGCDFMLNEKMINRLSKSTIVVINDSFYAVGLRYKKGIDLVPKVMVKASGEKGELLKSKALELKKPVVNFPALGSALYHNVAEHKYISEDLYAPIVTVLHQLLESGNLKPEDINLDNFNLKNDD